MIPTYRRTGPLRALLDSLVADEVAVREAEVILSDDGSGGEIAGVAAAYASHLPRLRYVTGENAGPGVARNRGVAAASTDVLLFVDSDCLVHPGWFAALARAIESGAALAFGPTRSAVPALEPFVHSIVSETELIVAANVAFSRGTFERLGGFRADLSRIAEDRNLIARARAAGIAPSWVARAVRGPPTALEEGPATASAGRRSSLPATCAPSIRRTPTCARTTSAKIARSWPRERSSCCWASTPFGLPAFIAHALLKRRDVNTRLEAAHVDFRVAASEAVKYGALQPVNDILRAFVHSVHLTGF